MTFMLKDCISGYLGVGACAQNSGGRLEQHYYSFCRNFGNQQQAHSQLLIPQASFQYSQVALNGQPLTGAGAGFNNGANGAVGGSFVSQGQNTG